MTEFKIICPECSATIISIHPESLIWERCPGCGTHVWDTYDLMMAEVAQPRHAHDDGVRSRAHIN